MLVKLHHLNVEMMNKWIACLKDERMHQAKKDI